MIIAQILNSYFLLLILQGKGQMKTYWLLGRDPVESTQAKCPFGSILLEELSKVNTNKEDVFSSSKAAGVNEQADFAELRSLYSPVSFEDVKKTMSNNASPKDSPAKKINSSPRMHRHGKNNNNSECTASQASSEHCPIKDKNMFIIRKNDLRKPNERNKMYEYQNTSKTCQLL